jgi:hypothetical protein
MYISTPILAYFSPETLLPVTSAVATVAGVAMMVGRGSLRLVARGYRRALRRSGPARAGRGPLADPRGGHPHPDRR